MRDSLTDVLASRLRALYAPTRLGQFVGVGVVGGTVDTVALFALVELTVLGPVVAKALSWELSIAVIFAINERWTFSSHGDAGGRALGRRFLRSNVVRFGGFIVTLAVLAVLVYGVGIWYLAANLAAIAAGFVVNYICESLYTWRVHHD